MSASQQTWNAGEDSTQVPIAKNSPKGALRTSPRCSGRGDLLVKLLAKPELVRNRSFVIQAAVDEFQNLARSDASLTPDVYCRRFAGMDSALCSSIFRQLEVEEFVNNHAWLKDKLQHEPWPNIGERRGSFVVAEEIGRGTLSRVYLCTQPDLGNRQVVVKLASTSLGEANSLGRLHHRNIVPVYSVERDEDSGMSMLCMPFLGRSTLFDLLDQLHRGGRAGKEALQTAATIWEQPSDRLESHPDRMLERRVTATHHVVACLGARLADALAHAHRNGIFHGDIKPSNILLTRDGSPLLMDFNLSGDLARSITANGGTLPYMPPEQVRSVALGSVSAGRYEARSDVYSLGVVLYEALTGRLPFIPCDTKQPLEALASKMLEIQERGPTPIRCLAPNVPRRLAEVIHKCIAFHPDNRVPDAGQLTTLLRAEYGRRSQLGWFCRRYKKSLYATGIVVILTGAAGGVALANRPPRHERLVEEAIGLRSEGRTKEAKEKLEVALVELPTYAAAQFELARTAMLSKSLLVASEELVKLEALQPDARSAAYTAYCFNLRGRHDVAIAWYLMALERGGDTPEVLNNLAYSYEFGRSALLPHDERTACYKYLAKALRLKPDFPSAQINWILLSIRRFQEDGIAMPQNVPQICRSLIRAFPDSGFIHDSAASAFAIMGAHDPAFSGEAIAYLSRAIDLGHGQDTSGLQASDIWKPFRDDPAFLRIASRATASPSSSAPGFPLIVEPISLSSQK